MELDSGVKGTRKFGRFTGRFDSIYRVRVRGIFLAEGGHHGHLNGYDYLFLIREVYSAKRLWEMTPSQPKVPPELEVRACQP